MKNLRLSLRRFAGARGGVAALEFALILPMMVLLFLGSVEIINLLQTNRRAENVTTSIADVISRDTIVTNSEMTGIWAAIAPLMFPNDPSMDVRITSIQINSGGVGHVVWYERQGSTYPALVTNSTVNDLPAGMNLPSTSVIRVETTYRYTPTLGLFFMDANSRIGADRSTQVLRHVSYRRSRLVDPIDRLNS